ncbi:MAG TPA: ComEC/Rec2 family competence protein, partial [Patescibacteria group bacterium]|nr:ComEC/Rec2 family competence protein [Patescibacteria group bacterium]
MIPFGARIGIGALGAGLAAMSGVVPPAAIVASAAAATGAIAITGTRRSGALGTGGVHRASIGILVGAWLVILRLAIAPAGPEPSPALPSGPGPWTGRVVSISAPRDGQQRLTVVLDEPFGVALAVTAPRYPAVEPGDRVRLDGRPTHPPEGGYGEYLRRSGVAGTVRAGSLELVTRAGDAAGLLERTRRAAGDSLTRALPEPAAGLAAGILIGLRDRVDRDLAAAFTATGLSHVVAISGWNIAIVVGLVGAVLAGRARRTRSAAVLVAVVAYTVLAGASASVVRAAAMTGVALLARESGRPGSAAAALGWAVASLVIANPASANDVGLQLSAAATAGLIAWSAPITAFLGRRVGRMPRWVREGLGVSLAA